MKFSLENPTDTSITKILKYNHPLTTDITLYGENKIWKEGLYYVPHDRNTFTPVFKLTLEPHSQNTYYMQLGSNILPLIVDLKLYDEARFHEEEHQHMMVLSLFFGAMGVLFVYNLFIFLFTRDQSYFYYILYLFGVTLHHGLYTGILYIFLPQKWITLLAVDGIYGVISIFVVGIVLFAKSFIRTSQYPRIDRIFNIILILLPFAVIGSITGILGRLESVLFLIAGLYTVFVSVYAALKGNRQAYFVVAGWACIFFSFIVIVVSNNGLFNIFEHFRYAIETGLFLEAVIFSIALADRINQLQKQKIHLSNALIEQQKTEERRLSTLVEERTQELHEALHDKELLFQELNHRVKNNMQTIISLLRLQSKSSPEESVKKMCVTVQNRINAMNELHELLYFQNNLSHINTSDYFHRLIAELQKSLQPNREIEIHYDIASSLNISADAITCGIILNELVTNAYKYAFDHHGIIEVKLYQEKSDFIFIVKDNGKGYQQVSNSESLGLKIVNILVEKQLKGIIQMRIQNGVENIIRWPHAER